MAESLHLVMDQWIQYKLGKQYLLKENYTTLGIEPRTYSYPGIRGSLNRAMLSLALTIILIIMVVENDIPLSLSLTHFLSVLFHLSLPFSLP